MRIENFSRPEILDGCEQSEHYITMIEVMRLNGKKYWINPHMIESMEENPDLTLAMLSGRKIVVKDKPEDIIEKIIAYRKKIGINTQEV